MVNNNGVETLYYGYTDNQGSLIALTDASGNVVEKYAYDPWGARRNPADWTQKDSRTSWITNRGYTMHEHIDAFGIINMNGRVYDPQTAMFMNTDPLLQSPDNWVNCNRYSYCFNNPLIYSDPSGYANEASTERQPWEILRDGGTWANYSAALIYGNGGYTGGDGGGGGGYHYLGGSYFNSLGEPVPFSEVYNNYILANRTVDNNQGIVSGLLSYLSIFAFNRQASLNYQPIGINSGTILFDKDDGLQFDTRYQLNIAVVKAESGSNNGINNGFSINGNGIIYNEKLDNFISSIEVPLNTFHSATSTVTALGKGLSLSTKILGHTSNVLAAASIGYDFVTGTANTSTVLNGAVMVGGFIAIGVIGVAAAPWVAGIGVIYGISSFVFEKPLNNWIDISGSINFVQKK